jgi:hypothetical protein
MRPENLDNSEGHRFPEAEAQNKPKLGNNSHNDFRAVQSTGQVYVKADTLEKNLRKEGIPPTVSLRLHTLA